MKMDPMKEKATYNDKQIRGGNPALKEVESNLKIEIQINKLRKENMLGVFLQYSNHSSSGVWSTLTLHHNFVPNKHL